MVYTQLASKLFVLLQVQHIIVANAVAMPSTLVAPIISLPMFWSVVVYMASTAALLAAQNLVSRSKLLSQHASINEFLFSAAWIILSFESCVMSQVSTLLGLASVGVRIFFSPYLFPNVYANPVGLLFHFLHRSAHSRNHTHFLYPLVAQILAVPVGLAVSITLWQLLATVSDDHYNFLEMKMEHFLSVTPTSGFLVEATLSLFMFLPGIFLPKSVFFRFLDTLFILYLILQFGLLTGGFMNPMFATACLFMWHSETLDVWEGGVHLGVFWLGPVLGTILAVMLSRNSHYLVKGNLKSQ